ncbi:MAG: hypothetical protein RLZZ546_8 [Bacteroidota bacterium]
MNSINKKIKIRTAILTNFIPHYRSDFYERLFGNENIGLSLYLESNVKMTGYTLDKLENRNIKYFYTLNLFSERLKFHFYPFWKILRENDIIIFDGNPRNVLIAICMTFAALGRKKIGIWSTAHSFRNAGLAKKIRLTWWNIFFKNFIMYVDCDILELGKLGFKSKIIESLSNGLDYSKIKTAKENCTDSFLKQFTIDNNFTNKKIMLSIGRLEMYRHDLIFRAFAELSKIKPDLHWVIIGDGNGKADLEKKLSNAKLENRVLFTGSITDENQLAPFMMVADFMVYSAPIGLSLIHSFSYGLPVITHNDRRRHGPEFCAFELDKTGLTFEKDDEKSLVNCIIQFFDKGGKQYFDCNKITELASEKHNTERMSISMENFLFKVNKN